MSWAAESFSNRQDGNRSTHSAGCWTDMSSRRFFVVHEPSLRKVVYVYFTLNFVYVDEEKATFFFEKSYWERIPAEMKDARF